VRRRVGSVLTAAALVLMVAGALVFFLADPLGLPDRVLEVLDQRASVIAMLSSLMFGLIGLWLQRRAPVAPPSDGPAATVSTTGTHAPAVGTISGGTATFGERSPSVTGNVGTLFTGDVTLAPPPAAGSAGTLFTGGVMLAPPQGPAPATLSGMPAAPAGFTGRDEPCDELIDFLTPSDGEGGTAAVVSAVAGMAGIGKTALALITAHHAQRAGWYPGGVLFLDLHGYTPGTQPVHATAAAGQLLRALGHRPEDLPAADEELPAAWRSALASLAERGTGVLVVADNAADPVQVEPLIPAQPCHRLLVTSRHTLASLPARQIDLATLGRRDAADLLERSLKLRHPNDDRVADDPGAAAEIARLCGGLPLALQISAAVLATQPDWPLNEMAAELTQADERLNVLQAPDHGVGRSRAVRAAFDLSYQRLAEHHPDQARLFRLLAAAPGTDISTTAAAALDGRPQPAVRRDLTALAAAHLIDSARGRWGMHDLVRLHAAEQSTSHAANDGEEEALDRLFTHYRQHAEAANARMPPRPDRPVSDVFPDRAAALAWFDAERGNLVAAVSTARHPRRLHDSCTLAGFLVGYLSWRRYFGDWLTVAEAAVEAAGESGDRHGEGVAFNSLGIALQEVRQFDEAITAHQDARTIYQETGDRHGEGMALNNLGIALREVRQFDEAIAVFHSAVELFEASGDPHRAAIARTSLKELLDRQGEP
jgi:tetratricopeptide (TPR) repeat protein